MRWRIGDHSADTGCVPALLRILGLGLLGGGAVLLWLGFSASESSASAMTRLFSGSPTRESFQLLVAGAAAAAAGLGITLLPALGRMLRRR